MAIITFISVLIAWYCGAFDHNHQADHDANEHDKKEPIDFSQVCPKYFLMDNGKCDESINSDWR